MLYGVCTGTGRESPYVPAFFCIEQASQSLPDGAKAYETAGNSGGRGKVRTCDPTRVKEAYQPSRNICNYDEKTDGTVTAVRALYEARA
jgi:hypothetical protein